ncbi:transposase [Caldibacillus thermoamylovorans]
MYIDETPIRSYHVLRTTWSEVGHQKQVPTFGHHAHVSLFGEVNIHDGETVLHPAGAANATTFLDFLRVLKERYPDRLIVLVLDNARIHHAKMVREFLREEGRCFHFISLPPYSPQVLSKVYPPHSRFSLEFQRLNEKKLATPVVFGHY